MNRSINYKIAKASVLPLDQMGLFKKPSAEVVAEALLSNPSRRQSEDDVYHIAVLKAHRLPDGPHIVAGKIVRGRQKQVTKIKSGDVTDEWFPDHPYCDFYFSEKTQIMALQATEVTRSFEHFLKLLSSLLSRLLKPDGLYVHLEPLRDPTQFIRKLREAFKVESVWFSMVPPNSYTRDRAKQFAKSVAEATRTRNILLRLDSYDELALNPKAPIIDDLSAECGDGNGHCGAAIIAAKGGKQEYIESKRNQVVHQIKPEELIHKGPSLLDKLLVPVSLRKEDS
jgi:hypothetical protein